MSLTAEYNPPVIKPTMAKVNVVDKKVSLSLEELIKFQLITHCYIESLPVSESDLNCLTLLGIMGETDLTDFCAAASSKKVFKTTQTVRNCIAKMEKSNLVLKVGKSKKKITINPDIKVQTEGNILLNYKLFHLEPQES